MAQVLRRHFHWTDLRPDQSKPNNLTRRIGNNLNWRTPEGLWSASAPGVSASQGRPPHWAGSYDFSHESTSGRVQAFYRDATDPGNRAMVGVRVAAKPNAWVNIKALDIDNAVDVAVGGAEAAWDGLWTNTDLHYHHTGAALRKELHISAPGHPAFYEFSVKLPPGYTLTVTDSVGEITDDNGTAVMRIPAPYGWGSATDGLVAERIGVTMTLEDDRQIGGKPFKVMRLTPDPDDLAAATYPVTIDPTTTIVTNGADIEDANLYSFSPSNNYGEHTAGYIGAGSGNGSNRLLSQVMRVDKTLIPSGSLTRFDLFAYRYAHAWQIGSNFEINAAAISEGSKAVWNEGTVWNTTQAGSCSWTYRQWGVGGSEYSWDVPGLAGTLGEDVQGTTYNTNVATTKTTGDDELFTFTLGPEWAENWRDDIWRNDGWVLRRDPDLTYALGDCILCRATENTGGSTPYIEIDYTAASSDPWPIWTPGNRSALAEHLQPKLNAEARLPRRT